MSAPRSDEREFAAFLEDHVGLLTASALFLGLGTGPTSDQTESLLHTVLLGLGLMCLYELARAPHEQDDAMLDAFIGGLWLVIIAVFGIWTTDVIRYTPQALGVPVFVVLFFLGDLVARFARPHAPDALRNSRALRIGWAVFVALSAGLTSLLGLLFLR